MRSLTALQQTTLVAQREFAEHVRRPAFFTSTSVAVVLVVIGVVGTGSVQALVDGDGTAAAALPVSLGVLLVLGQLTAGAFLVAYGIVEERSSRAGELLVTRVRPRTVLAGKLLGLGTASLLQLLVLVVVGLVAVMLTPHVSIPAGLAGASGTILLWYVLAFTLYASLFAIAGAISARQDDLAQKLQPTMVLLAGVFGASVYAFHAPESALTRVLALVPVTAPGVMPARAAATSPATWELPLAIALTLATAASGLWLAGTVFTPSPRTTR